VWDIERYLERQHTERFHHSFPGRFHLPFYIESIRQSTRSDGSNALTLPNPFRSRVDPCIHSTSRSVDPLNLATSNRVDPLIQSIGRLECPPNLLRSRVDPLIHLTSRSVDPLNLATLNRVDPLVHLTSRSVDPLNLTTSNRVDPLIHSIGRLECPPNFLQVESIRGSTRRDDSYILSNSETQHRDDPSIFYLKHQIQPLILSSE